MKFTGKVVIVTGAGQGMGRAIAQRFAQEGANVIAVDVNQANAIETLELVQAKDSMARVCNIADSTAVKALFEEVSSIYKRLDVLVNNAGIGTSKNDGFGKMLTRQSEHRAQIACGKTPTVYPDLIVDMADEGWRGVMKVNLDGTFFCTREAVRLMISSGIKGSIINISSTAAISGEGPLHYAASKAALVGMTRSLARELGARGIRVNNVMPGPVNTPIMQNVPQDWINSMVAGIPLGRIGEPADIAGVVVFLASDDAAMITGSDLVANGGSYFK